MWVVLSAADMTFSSMNVLQTVQEVKDTDYLRECLGIPRFQKKFVSETQQRKEYINYFIENDPEASWRSVICILDGMAQEDTVKAADKIRHLAEDIPGRPGTNSDF